MYILVFYLAIINKVLRHCHSWLARQYLQGNFPCFFFVCWFFQNQLFWKILSGISSECHTVCILIKSDVLSGLICVQTVCKSYQQTTLVGKELMTCWHSLVGSLNCNQYEPRSDCTLRIILIRVHIVCLQGENILECIWIYATVQHYRRYK